MRNIFIVFLLLLTTGCSLQQRNFNHLANQLEDGTQKPEEVISSFDESPEDVSVAQYYLNLGYLQLLSGEFGSAVKSLTLAKEEMLLLEASSISENAAAATLNETFRRYSGYPTDRVMVHNMLALSYLFNQSIDEARVEMLQADIAMKKLVKEESSNGQLISTHLLSGIIYELLNERSNSFISYQFAEGILIDRKMNVPDGIKLSLLRMSKKMGNNERYQHYRKKYSKVSNHINSDKQIFNLYFDGVVSNKIQKSIMVQGKRVIRISMPDYPRANYRMKHVLLSDYIHKVKSGVVENVEVLVREDLKNEYPSILLATTARAVVKYTSVKLIEKQDPLLGALANIFTVLSEVADVRSWNMLPSTVQFNYLETDANKVAILTDNYIERPIELNKNKQHVILSSSLSDKVFHYQQ